MTFTITAETSRAFAAASGDYNPLHLNPVAARRTQFGQTLIHGVCGTLAALDQYLAGATAATALASIRVKYTKPVSQGQALTLLVEERDGGVRLQLAASDSRCQVIDLRFGAATTGAATFTPPPQSAPPCRERAITDCGQLQGDVPLYWDEGAMTHLFPHATRLLPAQQLATLLACTRIVGMECPGLHSVFAGLELDFADHTPPTGEAPSLGYRVSATNERIGQVNLQLCGPGVEGQIEAFFRAPPVQQATLADILPLVAADEFSGQAALVIGASRGLGEVIAKVLAAGGARLMLTYAAGRDDARRLREEIAQQRPAPECRAFNALEGIVDEELAEFCRSASHIYYLASPAISRNDSRHWDRAQFDRYCDFYLHGMARLLAQVEALRPAGAPLTLFLPSSVFLEEKVKGFDEYVAAKAAAEAWAQALQRSRPGLRVAAPRLPRLRTDQTSGVRGLDERQTLAVIIDTLRTTVGAVSGPAAGQRDS